MFLILLVAPALTLFLYFQYEKSVLRSDLKERMIAGMEKDELVVLKFTQNEIEKELNWEHSGEFEYQGKMYDIIQTKVQGDSIYYTCWLDEEETKLEKQLTKLVAQAFAKDTKNRDKKEHFYSFLRSFYCSNYLDWKALPIQKGLCKNQDFIYRNNFNSLKTTPPTPPPQLS